MNVLLDILPIFLVIAVGLVGTRRGWLPEEFIAPANRVAYYLAIPALIFRAVATSPLAQALQVTPALAALAAQLTAGLVAVAVSARLFSPEERAARASWVHCAVHGNQAVMGLAVVYYALGEKGLAAAGLIAGAVIVGQNLWAVFSLTRLGAGGGKHASPWRQMLLSPIIIATLAGLAWSLGGLVLPGVIERTLGILGGMGLPLALLTVGARLAQGRLGRRWGRLAAMQGIKLLLLPALGLGLVRLAGVPAVPAAVTVVLLSSPSAIISVIMASQMGGDSRLASQAVVVSHALCVLTYTAWLAWLLP